MLSIDRPALDAALPGYEIGEELGRGASGVVFAARHRRLGRDVAVKVLPPALAADPEVKRRFVEEARVLASFSHPHIVPIYDFVEVDDLCALVMERLEGGTMAERHRALARGGDVACALTLAVCAALHYAHGNGVLHRDVKPENALFSMDGTLKVTDFGVAKMLTGSTSQMTRQGLVLGTPSYMAPEQALGGKASPATDVYATGVVLYWMLAGRLPFADDGNPLQVLYRRVNEEPLPLTEANPEVSEALAEPVMRSLARDPAERFASAEEFGVAVASAASGTWGEGWLRATGIALGAGGPISAAAHGVSPSRSPAGFEDVPTTVVPEDEPASTPAGFDGVPPTVVPDDGPPGGAPPPEPPQDPTPAGAGRPGGRRRIPLAVAGALAGAAVIAGGIALLASGGDDGPSPQQAAAPTPAAAPPIRASSPWRPLPPAPTARQQVAAAVHDGTVWVLGGLATGRDGLPAATRAVEAFDPVIKTWQAGPPLPLALHHAMGADAAGSVVVLGGWVPDGGDISATTSRRAFALRGDRWSPLPSMPDPRAAGAAVAVGGRIVLVGGQADGRLVAATDVFDGRRWHRGAPIPTPREHLAAATDGRYVYAVGGRALSSDRNSAALERYDPRADRWTTLPPMPGPRGGIGAAIVGGSLLVVGGETPTRALDRVDAYDIAARRWKRLPSLRIPRHGAAVVAVGRAVYVLGGAQRPGHANATAAAEMLSLSG